jgi:phage shock protein A
MSQEWMPQDDENKRLPDQNAGNAGSGSQSSGASDRPFSTFRAQPATPPPPPPAPPKKSNTWIYLVIIALLLGGCIYLFLDRRKETEKVNAMTMQRDTVIISRDNIQTEYNAALARLDDLTSKNADLLNETNNKDGEISKLKNQIEAIIKKEKKTEGDVAQAQKLITQLRGKVRGFEERIAELEGENSKLTQERDEVKTTNTGLQEKVKLGSVLHASNIRMNAIDLRRNGTKQRETGKARKADLLRIQFDIDDNRIAESGSKEIYILITAPDGSLLSNAAFGSGTTTDNQGNALNYTMAKQITLAENQAVKDITVDWNQDSDYMKGDYNIELYHEGFKIGDGSVKLK